MALDLYNRESLDRISSLQPVENPEAGVFDGFLRGTGLYAMRGFATTARAVDLLGSVGPIVQDRFTGGTEAQDRYFREHDDVFGSAVDYWTPRPNEVGQAAQVAGNLLSMLPTVITSPSLAVGAAQLSAGEELVQKGVSAEKAQAVGALEAGATGLGVWMPILGKNGWQRIFLGGAAYNAAQGVAVRGGAHLILQGDQAAEEYKAFDPTALTLDVLLGMAFGSLAHLSPEQRAQGARAWDKISKWTQGWRPSDVDAVAALRQAQHLNVDSVPGTAAGPEDIAAHVDRISAAIDQLAKDKAVEVSDQPEPNVVHDPAREAENQSNLEFLQEEAARLAEADLGPQKPPTVDAMSQAIERVGEERFQQLVGEHLASFGEKLAPTEEAFAVEQVARWIVGGAFDRQMEIPFAEKLTPEQRVVETHAREQVLGDIEGQLRAYEQLPDSEGGKIINTDVARELFPEYRQARSIHSPSVHEPASALTKELYARKLAEPDPNGLNMVTFTAGGTGAGKTTALGAVPLASKIVEVSQIVYDTNLATFASAVKKVDQALAAGKQVNIMYVGADPEEALRRALHRATRTGRTVPLEEHAKTHQGSAETIAKMMEHYQGNDQVQFVILDNGSSGKGDVRIVEPAEAGAYFKSLNFKNLPERLQGVLDAEKAAGRIDETIYQGTTQRFPEEAGPAPSARGEGEPAGGRPAGEGAGAEVAPGRARTLEEPLAPGEAQPPAERPSAQGAPTGEARAGISGEGGEMDPVAATAERFVVDNPDLQIAVGQNADGTAQTVSARDYLDGARAATARAREDASLFRVAAECLLGGGA